MRRRKIYRKPRPSRIGWQELAFEHPRGHGGIDVGAELEASKVITPIVAICRIAWWWWWIWRGSAFSVVYVAKGYNTLDGQRRVKQSLWWHNEFIVVRTIVMDWGRTRQVDPITTLPPGGCMVVKASPRNWSWPWIFFPPFSVKAMCTVRICDVEHHYNFFLFIPNSLIFHFETAWCQRTTRSHDWSHPRVLEVLAII